MSEEKVSLMAGLGIVILDMKLVNLFLALLFLAGSSARMIEDPDAKGEGPMKEVRGVRLNAAKEKGDMGVVGVVAIWSTEVVDEPGDQCDAGSLATFS